MTVVASFQPRSGLLAQQNMDAFIAHCRDDLALYDWNSLRWQHSRTGRNVATFTRYGVEKPNYPKPENAFSEPYLSQAKAIVRYKQSVKESTAMGAFFMQAIKLLYDALASVHVGKEPDFLDLDGVVQSRANEILIVRLSTPSTRNKVGNALKSIYDFVREKAFTPSLPQWVNPHSRQKARATQTDPESLEWQKRRLPTLHQITAMADCFARAETLEDQFWSSVMVLLMFAPSRAGELASLTTDCLVEREGNLYVRWIGKKGFGGYQKMVPMLMEPAVRSAVARLTTIGAPARKAAKFAVKYPRTFMHHPECLTPKEYPQDQPLNSDQVALAMGYTPADRYPVDSKGAWNALENLTENCSTPDGFVTYRSLADYVFSVYGLKGRKQREGEEQVQNAGDSDRPIWESLIILRDREFNKQKGVVPFSWKTVSVGNLNDQLSGRETETGRIASIFERMGLTNQDGSRIQLTSHQIRVWLSTVAERAGMDDWTIAHWAARTDMKHNEHYDLRSAEEVRSPSRTIMVPEHSDDPSMVLATLTERPTAIELVRMNQPVAHIDLGKVMVGAAQSTLCGYCITDWAQNPCSKAHQCVMCREHRCIKGDDVKLKNLQRYRDFLRAQLDLAEQAVEEDYYGADVWLERHQNDFSQASKKIQELTLKLATTETVVKILQDPSVPDGAVISVPPEFDPDPVERALNAQGASTAVRREDIIATDNIFDLVGIPNAQDYSGTN